MEYHQAWVHHIGKCPRASVTTLNQYKKRAKVEASTRLNNSLVEASTV